jgi:1,4-alpha-glucan branching enzyme
MVHIRHVSSERPTLNTQCFYAAKHSIAQDFLGRSPEGDGNTLTCLCTAQIGIVVVVILVMGNHLYLDGNFWEAWAPACGPGEHYLYRIYHYGSYQEHCDPYGFAMELRPSWRSIVCDLSFTWHDQSWMDTRAAEGQQATYTQPMNIDEMHLGSWRTRSGDTPSDNPEDWVQL